MPQARFRLWTFYDQAFYKSAALILCPYARERILYGRTKNRLRNSSSTYSLSFSIEGTSSEQTTFGNISFISPFPLPRLEMSVIFDISSNYPF